jgi:hypothetical protein
VNRGLWCGTGVPPEVMAAQMRTWRLEAEARKREAMERLLDRLLDTVRPGVFRGHMRHGPARGTWASPHKR